MNTMDKYFSTPVLNSQQEGSGMIMAALECSRSDRCRILIDAGADLDAVSKVRIASSNHSTRRPMYCLAHMGH